MSFALDKHFLSPMGTNHNAMRKAIEDSLFSLIAPPKNPKTNKARLRKGICSNSKVYSSVVLEGNKLEEAIHKANAHDEFEYIIDALRPARLA